jgi:hypothetical protein
MIFDECGFFLGPTWAIYLRFGGACGERLFGAFGIERGSCYDNWKTCFLELGTKGRKAIHACLSSPGLHSIPSWAFTNFMIRSLDRVIANDIYHLIVATFE